jgi:hypothetical protein
MTAVMATAITAIAIVTSIKLKPALRAYFAKNEVFIKAG